MLVLEPGHLRSRQGIRRLCGRQAQRAQCIEDDGDIDHLLQNRAGERGKISGQRHQHAEER
ncbi:hypothetical protein D3C81_807520 [compost metagenome]